MLSALFVMAGIALVLGAVLGYASIRFKVEGDPLVDRIDAILPQTQCGQCGFPGCRPYANAISRGEADINQCPPGGEEGIRKLSDLLGREFKPLNAENGVDEMRRCIIEHDALSQRDDDPGAAWSSGGHEAQELETAAITAEPVEIQLREDRRRYCGSR